MNATNKQSSEPDWWLDIQKLDVELPDIHQVVLFLTWANIERLLSFQEFEAIYNHNVSTWCWKERSLEERKKIFSSYYVYKDSWNIVWWFSIKDIWNNEFLLECIFSSQKWIWTTILNHLKSQIPVWNKIVAFSKKEDFFMKAWFTRVEWDTSPTWAQKYTYTKE